MIIFTSLIINQILPGTITKQLETTKTVLLGTNTHNAAVMPEKRTEAAKPVGTEKINRTENTSASFFPFFF